MTTQRKSNREKRVTKWKNEKEELDCTPVEIPLGAELPESLEDQIRRFVTLELDTRDDQTTTFEEEDDFTEENPDVLDFSQYEFPEIQEDYESPPLDPPQAPQEADMPAEVSGDTPDPPAEPEAQNQPDASQTG